MFVHLNDVDASAIDSYVNSCTNTYNEAAILICIVGDAFIVFQEHGFDYTKSWLEREFGVESLQASTICHLFSDVL